MEASLLLPLLATKTSDAAYQINIFDQVVQARGVVLAVLIVLMILSLVSWFIMGYKALLFFRLRRLSRHFGEAFWDSESLEDVKQHADTLKDSPLARIFLAGYGELGRVTQASGGVLTADHLANVERATQRATTGELTRLERLVPFLATTGSSAPFIGLFGTVWGIMNAFAYINPNRPILETVTPHIAQALVATAIGLLAAIPAVMGYNYFVSKIKVFASDMDAFSTDLLNIFRRKYS